MHALLGRDRALKEVVRLRDTGKIRQAKDKLKLAESLHARVGAIDEEFAAARADDEFKSSPEPK